MIGATDHIRAEIMAQPEAGRLDYALDLLAWYLDPVHPWLQGARDLGVCLDLADLRQLHALDAERGRWVTVSRLLAARCLDRLADDWPAPEKVFAGNARIRAALSNAGIPLVLETWRHVGYRISGPADFRFDMKASAKRCFA
ncbi:MAG: hypothetical protein HRU30_20715 [Rhodobacteraceae bacterium]|nr:hypothetical protein [Paracoccaceae bacterium]